MDADVTIVNDQIVCDLRDALRDGKSGLEYVPRLLRRLLETEAWRERTDRAMRRPVNFETFAEFVTAQPTAGLGADLGLVRRIVANDPVTLDLFDQATTSGHGGDRRSETFKADNITLERHGGTSREYALQRLRSDAPELHARVLAGDLSPHAAMVQAGFRPPTFTVRGESAEDVVRTLRRRLPDEVLAEVGRLINSAS